MKRISLVLILQMVFCLCHAQLYSTRNGFIGFYSKTPLEDVIAENNQVYAVMNVSKKTLAFSMLMKGFVFKKELMQEHFNENYVESDVYPKATFTGSFAETVDASKNGNYTLHVTGTITLHGVSKPFSTIASLEVNNNVLNGTANFTLLPSDFNIQIPSLVAQKIAKEISVQVKVSLHS